MRSRECGRSIGCVAVLLCGLLLLAPGAPEAQGLCRPDDLAKALEKALRASDFAAASDLVAAPPPTVQAFRRVVELRLGNFRDRQAIKVYAVRAGDKRAEDGMRQDMQTRGAKFTPLAAQRENLKALSATYSVPPVGWLVVLDGTNIFTVTFGEVEGRCVIAVPGAR
jgi:hypothetical protein